MFASPALPPGNPRRPRRGEVAVNVPVATRGPESRVHDALPRLLAHVPEFETDIERILIDLDHEIEGRNVLIVEDIVDSGLTLAYLLKMLRTRRPASLEVCALMQKTGVQQVPLDIKYKLFEIPPVFVVGYG